MHGALQLRIFLLNGADLFQRTRVGAHVQLEMSGVEMADRMAVSRGQAGLAVAGVQLPGGDFDKTGVVIQVAGEAVERLVEHRSMSELEIAGDVRVADGAGNLCTAGGGARYGYVLQIEHLHQAVHRTAAQRAASREGAGVVPFPIVHAEGNLELHVHLALHHGTVAHADSGGRDIGVTFERIEVFTLEDNAGNARMAGDLRILDGATDRAIEMGRAGESRGKIGGLFSDGRQQVVEIAGGEVDVQLAAERAGEIDLRRGQCHGGTA